MYPQVYGDTSYRYPLMGVETVGQQLGYSLVMGALATVFASNFVAQRKALMIGVAAAGALYLLRGGKMQG